MSVANKAKGAAFEIAVMKYLRSRGQEVDRLRLSGRDDQGDLVWRNGGLVFIFELKNTKVNNLTDYVRQAKAEAENYAKHRDMGRTPSWAAIVKKRNAPISESFVVTSLEEYLNQTGLPF